MGKVLGGGSSVRECCLATQSEVIYSIDHLHNDYRGNYCWMMPWTVGIVCYRMKRVYSTEQCIMIEHT